MRHGLAHRKLGRDSAHRKALLRNLVTSLVLHDRITTTLPKAKEVQPLADKLITLAKKGTTEARKAASGILFQPQITVPKLWDIMVARYANRSGGYTRILKTSHNPRDASPQAIIEYVDAPGDTALALAQRQLQPIRTSMQELTQSLANLHLPASSDGTLEGRFSHRLKEKLQRRLRALSRTESKLTKVVQQAALVAGHEETKYPAKNMEVRVHKMIWTEPLPGRRFANGKVGPPRVVVRVARKTQVMPRIVPDAPPKPKRIQQKGNIRFKPIRVKYNNAHLRV